MILCNNQYGFLEKHFTSHALISFINKVANAIDDKKKLQVSFWTYRKLLTQLKELYGQLMEIYGLSGIAIDWVKCYLSNRMQVVQISGITSHERELFLESPRDLFWAHCLRDAKSLINYSTRYAESYRHHLCRTNMKQSTISYQGPKWWNSLPHSIIASNNIRTFKLLLKSYLINLQNIRIVCRIYY